MLEEKIVARPSTPADPAGATPAVAVEPCGRSHGPACRETPPARCDKDDGHFGEHYCPACGTVFT